jgi:tRNA (guanine-N7-)-methyltransferase
MTSEKIHDPSSETAATAAPSRRTVRSFVIRGGRQTVAQQRAMDELWPHYGIEFSGQPIDLEQVFGRLCTGSP